MIEMQLTGYCLDCRKQHTYHCEPTRLMHCMGEWEAKHVGHRIEFRSRERRLELGHRPSLYRRLMEHFDRLFDRYGVMPWYLSQFDHNSDVKIAYVNAAAYTITLASLATSSTLLAGQESTAINNSSLYLDYLVGGKITVGTTPTANTKIEVWNYATNDETPTYPDVFDGTDSNETATTAEIKRGALKLMKVLDVVSTTSDIAQWMGPVSVAACYGGVLPSHHGLFVVHNTGANLNATGGNHVLRYRAAYGTVG